LIEGPDSYCDFLKPKYIKRIKREMAKRDFWLFEFFENLESLLDFIRFMCDWEKTSKDLNFRHTAGEGFDYVVRKRW